MSIWPFKPTPLLEPEAMQWHVDNACWVLRHLPNRELPRKLILPGPGFFKVGSRRGHALACHLFEQTRAFMDLTERPMTLIADAPEPLPCDQSFTPKAIGSLPPPQGACEILYPNAWQDEPFALIACFAFQLGREWVASIDDAPPADDYLPAVGGVAACMMGFGVFLADDAIIAGYGADSEANAALGELDLLFDLALFLTANRLPPDDALRFLKPYLDTKLRQAMKDAEPFRPALLDAKAGIVPG